MYTISLLKTGPCEASTFFFHSVSTAELETLAMTISWFNFLQRQFSLHAPEFIHGMTTNVTVANRNLKFWPRQPAERGGGLDRGGLQADPLSLAWMSCYLWVLLEMTCISYHVTTYNVGHFRDAPVDKRHVIDDVKMQRWGMGLQDLGQAI